MRAFIMINGLYSYIFKCAQLAKIGRLSYNYQMSAAIAHIYGKCSSSRIEFVTEQSYRKIKTRPVQDARSDKIMQTISHYAR